MKLIELIGKFFAWTPISVLIGLACIVVGIIILVMPSILGFPLPEDWTAYIQDYIS